MQRLGVNKISPLLVPVSSPLPQIQPFPRRRCCHRSNRSRAAAPSPCLPSAMMAAPTPPKAAAQLVRVESIATVARTTTTAAQLPLVPVPVTGSYAVKSKRQENQVVNMGAPAAAPAPAAKVKPCTEPGRKLAPKKHGVKKLAKKGSLAALTAATAPTRHHPQGVHLRSPKVIFQLLAWCSTAIDCALRIVIFIGQTRPSVRCRS
jgi:hypothetical protein